MNVYMYMCVYAYPDVRMSMYKSMHICICMHESVYM